MVLARSQAWATRRLSSNSLKLLTYGITRNCLLLFRLTPFVVTVTNPVVAPLGTTAVKQVLAFTLAIAGVPLNETALLAVKPWPRIWIVLPTLPELSGGKKLTKGVSPVSRLNTV